MFDWLAVSPEKDYLQEALIVERLFDAGLLRYHLRKPDYSVSQCAALLEQLSDACRARVVVHQYYELVAQYGLAGCHVKDRPDANEVRDQQSARDLCSISMSRSIHSILNLDTCLSGWDYGFISPVFPSISKAGYAAEWTTGELRAALDQVSHRQLYALGGVSEDTCAACVEYGFKGAVLHGAFWMSGRPVEQFNKIKRVLE